MAKTLGRCIKINKIDADIAEELQALSKRLMMEDYETPEDAARYAIEELTAQAEEELASAYEQVYARFPELDERTTQVVEQAEKDEKLYSPSAIIPGTETYEEVGMLLDEAVGDAHSLLRMIESRGGASGALATAIMKKVGKSRLQKTKVVVSDTIIDEEGQGVAFYDGDTNEIVVSTDGATDGELLMHEVLHPLTQGLLAKDKVFASDMQGIKNAYEEALIEQGLFSREEIDSIINAQNVNAFERVREEMNDAQFPLAYSLYSLDEFTSEIFGNEVVLETMDDMVGTDDISILDKVIQVLLKALGLKGDSLATQALDRVLRAVSTPSEGYKGTREYSATRTALRVSKEVTGTTMDTFRDITKRYIQPISDRLYNMAPNMSFMLSNMDAEIARRVSLESFQYGNEWENEARSKITDPKDMEDYLFFLQKASQSSIPKAEAIADRYGVDMSDIWSTLEKVREEMISTGQISAKNRDKRYYFPRMVKDQQGLWDYYDKKGVLREISKILMARGIEVTPDNIALVMSETLGKGGYPALLGKPGSAKARSMQHFEEETAQFYYAPFDAYRMQTEDMINSIEQHKLVGASTRVDLEIKLNKLEEELEALEAKGQSTTDVEKEIDKLTADLVNPTEINKKGLGRYLATAGIDPKHQEEVRNIIYARFNEKGMSKNMRAIKHGVLAMTLLNPTTAIKQVADIGIAMTERGFKESVWAVKKALGSKADQFNLHEMGVQTYLQDQGERQDVTSQWLDKGFHYSGFKIMDGFGKQVSYQASLREVQNISKEEFVERYKDITSLEDKEGLYDKIQGGELTDKGVQDFMTWRVSQLQPLFLSQMSEKMLTAGNGRIFGTLLQYALRRLGMISSHIKQLKEDEGIFAASMYTMKVIGVLTAAEFGAECIAGILTGRPCKDIDEQLEKTTLGIMLLDRYTIDTMMEGKIVEGALSLSGASAIESFDTIGKSFLTLFGEEDFDWKMMKNLPFGKLPFFWFTEEGQKARDEAYKKSGEYKSFYESMTE